MKLWTNYRTACWCAAVVCVLTIAEVAASDVMTPELLASLRTVSAIAVSPDGNSIAYTVAVPRNPFVDDDGKSYYHLHVVYRDGNVTPFVTGDTRISAPSFTPDGAHVSYLAKRDDDDHISLWSIPLAGGESRKIIEFATDISAYAWSPDSRAVAFLAKDSLPAAIQANRKRGFNQTVFEEDALPVRVWLYNTSEGAAAPVRLDIEGSARNLMWSRDGRFLATTLAPTSLIDDYYLFRAITLIDATTGKVLRQYDTPGKLGRMAFSPDGRHIAFVAGADINDPLEGELWMVSVDSDVITKLITAYEGHVKDIAWKDNKTIVFLSDLDVRSALGEISVDGSGRTSTLIESGPVFSSLAISDNGRTGALVGSSPIYPNDVFAFSTKNSKPMPKRLTVTNPELADVDFARQEVVNFEARDGLALQGMLIYPLDYKSGSRYPVVLCVHGGPESHVRNNWITTYSYPGQIAAARGMAVFYPNYRGSTGRGIEFSKMGQADYAGGEFNDLVDAIDHLVDMGLADRSKIGITGRSYGGYATAWASTAFSEHFACGVMGVGVSDLISKFGTTDIPMEMYHSHARTWPWDNWQFYLERSPIYHADKSRTPLLILHGENDTRVHPSQSMELYRYLKTHGNAPVRMVIYKDEGHGTEKAAARYDSHLRMMRWLEHYLLGPGGAPPDYTIDYTALKPVEKQVTSEKE